MSTAIGRALMVPLAVRDPTSDPTSGKTPATSREFSLRHSTRARLRMIISSHVIGICTARMRPTCNLIILLRRRPQIKIQIITPWWRTPSMPTISSRTSRARLPKPKSQINTLTASLMARATWCGLSTARCRAGRVQTSRQIRVLQAATALATAGKWA